MAITFKRAVKEQSFLRLALTGPSGAGKTYTALLLAAELAGGQPFAVIDTERGSASKYSDIFTFDALELDTFHPDRYIEAIQAAVAGGYAVVVIDSLSHEWNSTGGALELHNQAVKRQKTQNSYTAWADITPLQNRLIDTITGSPIHVIATMRAKTEYVQDKNERGGTTIRKVGMAPIQRDGMEYEFDIVGDLDQDHTMVVSKSRCSALADRVIAKPDRGVAAILHAWLRGAAAAPTAQQPAAAATQAPQRPAASDRAAKATPTPAPSKPPQSASAQPAQPADERVARALKHETIAQLLTDLGITDSEQRQEKVAGIFKQLDDAKRTASARAIMDALGAELEELEANAANGDTDGAESPIPYDLHDLEPGARAS